MQCNVIKGGRTLGGNEPEAHAVISKLKEKTKNQFFHNFYMCKKNYGGSRYSAKSSNE